MTEANLKIAVFVDFDNIEIGVKSTLNKSFDIGAVLEAIKERGEIVTKVAYGDWKRSGDSGRAMGQHAIHMVQRNLTPGGDKNGADINLALDALEMAFTRNHINAFVIVGGDSDFITLVEKLKQYDKKVFIVGGRAFTSTILQKNCHEFIAYENLIRSQPSGRRQSRSRSASEAPVEKAVPLIRRALKILTDREVSPQLGLLKSTLLQLDSTFSERDYGATTFRDFMEKLVRTGVINLKQVDRSWLVELREERSDNGDRDRTTRSRKSKTSSRRTPEGLGPENGEEPAGAENGSDRQEEGLQVIRSVFETIDTTQKWPMYLRNVKQFLKSARPDFNEKEYGFSSMLDAVRQSQRAGVFRLERNRQGVLWIFPGDEMPKASEIAVEAGTAAAAEAEVALDRSVASGGVVPAVADPGLIDQAEAVPEAAEPEQPVRKRKTAATKTRKTTQKVAKKATKTTKTTRKKTTRMPKKPATKATQATRRTAKKMPGAADESLEPAG